MALTKITPTVVFQREILTHALIDEGFPLLQAHWAEIAHFKDIELNHDADAYLRMEENGSLRAFTLRDEGVLKGYAVFIVRANIHYKHSVQAVQDILYLAPELRGQMLGARFIEWCDEQLTKDGVAVVYHHVKHTLDFGFLLKRMGYESIETVWGRRLNP